jgi:hypothetical protein
MITIHMCVCVCVRARSLFNKPPGDTVGVFHHKACTELRIGTGTAYAHGCTHTHTQTQRGKGGGDIVGVRLWAFGVSCKKQTGRQGTKLLQLQSIRLSAEYHTQLLDKTSIW